jgi:hypothetical protein
MKLTQSLLMPGSCTASVVNITRHVKLCHPEVSPSSVQKKTPIAKVKREYKGRLMCAPCGTSTIRMDIHLINVHKLEKGSVQAVQLPTIQFFLALFCKIDNRDIMPHEYYKQQCATFIDNYS